MKRVEFINAGTGTRMWVTEDRVSEYTAAGHRPVAGDAEPDGEAPAKKPKTAGKKAKK